MSIKDLGFPGIRAEFRSALDLAEVGSWAARVGQKIMSDKELETYRFLGRPPQMREWIGGRQEIAVRDELYQLRNKKFESTLALAVDDLRRDKTGMLQGYIRDFATRPVTHWEKLLTDLIMSTSLTCYDGQQFFDTDHVSGDSGTQTNALTVTQVPSANVGTATAPTALEIANILIETVQYMYGYKDDAGEPINQNAKKFTVMVPVTMMGATLRAVREQLLASGTTNPLLAIKEDMSFDVIANPRLTWTDKLAVFRQDGAMKPLIMQSELEIQDSYLGEGSDETFKNDRVLYGIKCWRSVGYGMWQHAARVTLS